MTDRFEQRVGELAITTMVTGGDWRQNCYIVSHDDAGEHLVIDPGSDAERILSELDVRGGHVRHVLLTHAHHDHVGATAPLCRALGIDARLHEGDARLIRHAPLYAQHFAGRKIEMPGPIRILNEDERLEVGGRAVTVVPTPGHTKGSVIYAIGDVLFTGDTLLRHHVGRTDLPGGDAAVLKESVTLLINRFADDTIIFSGHGRPWTIAEARAWWAEAADAPPQFAGQS